MAATSSSSSSRATGAADGAAGRGLGLSNSGCPIVKMLLIGDSGVGKSSLLVRFCDNDWSPCYLSTIGIDYKVKFSTIQGKKVKLQIWDTAGQERFRSITEQYYRNAQGILLVYDQTSEESFKNVKNWMQQIVSNAVESVKVVLIANKSDMPSAVSPSQGQELADQFGIPFFVSSAKVGDGVSEAFTKCGELIVESGAPEARLQAQKLAASHQNLKAEKTKCNC